MSLNDGYAALCELRCSLRMELRAGFFYRCQAVAISFYHLIGLRTSTPHHPTPFRIFLNSGHNGRRNALALGLVWRLDYPGFLTSRLMDKDSIMYWPVQLFIPDVISYDAKARDRRGLTEGHTRQGLILQIENTDSKASACEHTEIRLAFRNSPFTGPLA